MGGRGWGVKWEGRGDDDDGDETRVAHSLDAAAALSRNASLGGPSRNHEGDSLSIMPCWGGGCGALSILSRWGGGL